MTRRSRRRSLWFANIGTVIEWYDFGLYLVMSVYLYAIFFPDLEKTQAQALILLIYALGYVSRTIAGCYFSTLADQKGRKSTFILSSSMMTLSTIMMALFPVHQMNATAVLLFFILLRMLQGMALGMEYPGGMVFIYEHATEENKLTTLLFCSVSSNCGSMIGLAVCYFMANHFSHQDIINYAWRIPYIIAATLGCGLFFIRHIATETPEFTNRKKQQNTHYFSWIINHYDMILIGLFIMLAINESVGSFIDMSAIYFVKYFHYQLQTVYKAFSVEYVVVFSCLITAIIFLKKNHITPVSILLCITMMIIAPMSFMQLQQHSLLPLIVCVSLMGCGSPILFQCIIFNLCERIPTEYRVTTVALFNNTTTMIGAISPFVINSVISKTHNPLDAAMIIFLLGVIMLIMILHDAKKGSSINKEYQLQ